MIEDLLIALAAVWMVLWIARRIERWASQDWADEGNVRR